MEFKPQLEEIDLKKYWLVLKRRWIPAASVFNLTVVLSVLVALSQKPSYESQARLLIKPDRSSSIVGLQVNSSAQDELRPLSQQGSPAENQVQLLTSIEIAKQTIASLNLTDNQGKPIQPEAFSKNLKVKNVPTTDVLEVTYIAPTPELAVAVVNKVVELYIKSNVTAYRSEADSARVFIDNQLPEVENAVRRAEMALRKFKEENKIIALDNEAQSAVTVISNLDQQITQLRSQVAGAKARSELLQSQLGMNTQQALATAALSQSRGVQDTLKQLEDAQNHLAVSSIRYREGHPEITNAERRIEVLKGLLEERISDVLRQQKPASESQLQVGKTHEQLIEDLAKAEVQRLEATSQLDTLVTNQATYRNRASSIPRMQQTQAALERELKAAQSTYETLLSRFQEVKVAANQNVGNVRILANASLPGKPVASRQILYVIAGIVNGLLLGALVAFGLDLMDRSVKTLKETKELLKYPLLGVLPDFSQVEQGDRVYLSDSVTPPIFARDLIQSPICDSYQALQANLQFLTSDKPLRSIVITSSVPQEGKSTVAANLAATMAQLGLRVLLVDADLRLPSQHHIWDVVNSSGLSHVSVGRARFESTTHTVLPNLDVLTAGVIPPNPVALLGSNHMASLVQSFTHLYDFVIFDTPPLAGTADALVLGKLTDGVLLVARPGVVNSASATAAKEYLDQAGQTVLGLVVNGVIVKSEPDSYFYHTRDSRAKTRQGVADSTGSNA